MRSPAISKHLSNFWARQAAAILHPCSLDLTGQSINGNGVTESIRNMSLSYRLSCKFRSAMILWASSNGWRLLAVP